MIRRLLCSALLTAAALAGRGQEAYLVKDINTTANTNVSSSSPTGFTRLGSKIYFAANSAAGRELWATDGTPSGTSQVALIERGFRPSLPRGLTVLNGKLLFNAIDDAHGEELWISDGTKDGTRLLADVNPGGQSSSPDYRIVYHGVMLFSASDAAHGKELWITDGTGAGTRLLKDLHPGVRDSSPSFFVLLGDTVYFNTYDGLWKTDGTADGTVLVAAAKSLYLSSYRPLVVSGNRLFFSALESDTSNRYVPWVSDGTQAGTRKIADSLSGGEILTPFRDGILFFAPGLWLTFSDGTAGGTRTLAGPLTPSAQTIAVVGDEAYFSTSTDLWKTNGTAEGTVAIRSSDGRSFWHANHLTSANGLLFFAASDFDPKSSVTDDLNKRTVWVSDGTAAGTHRLKTSGPLFMLPDQPTDEPFTNIDGTLYFAGADQRNGYEPWKSDGTDSGTVMIANIAPDGVPSSDPRTLTAAGEWVYFDAAASDDLSAPSLSVHRSTWRSDGTSEGTVETSKLTGPILATSGRAAFLYLNGFLWVSDGTPQGTGPAASLLQHFPPDATITLLFTSGDKLFFSVTPRLTNKTELWVTTASGSPPVRLGPKAWYRAAEVAGRVFFFVDRELWVTDGTPEGTHEVITLPAYPYATGAMGGAFYFSLRNDSDATLYRSDGTLDGTIALKTMPPFVSNGVTAGRKLFFTSAGQLWVTDGTPAGTRSLDVIPFAMSAAGELAVFSAADAANGLELWVSDGTVAGTHVLRDINPGAAGSKIDNLASAGGLVYFTAFEPLHGNEVWVTDGTEAGTRLASDIVPGPAGSDPASLTMTTERLFFSATTPATGRELWAIPLPAQLRVADIGVPESSSTARFTVSLPHALAQSVTVDYATADGTAIAGSDYEAASGTLTFAPGETSKTVDVRLRGDQTMENDEAFFLTLRNASGAVIGTPAATAVILDDDVAVDVAAILDFAHSDNFRVRVLAKNNGTHTASGLHASLTTVTPGPYIFGRDSCATQLAPGASGDVTGYSSRSGPQQYLTAAVAANERDPNPANNTVGWTTHDTIGMDALYVVPGTDANIWFLPLATGQATYTITSSNPAVVSVPASVTVTFRTPLSFVVHGLTAGSATVTVSSATSAPATLNVDVHPAGTVTRWPGAISVYVGTPQRFSDPVNVIISPVGTAPFTGENATGRVAIKADGREVGHLLLDGSARVQSIYVYLPVLGPQTVTVEYAGDRNFLPSSTSADVAVGNGIATILAAAVRFGTTATLRVRVIGSPYGTPTGMVTVRDIEGSLGTATAPLAGNTPGTGEAIFTFTNVAPGAHFWTISYSGDSRYTPGSQSVRLGEARQRAERP